MDKIAKFNDERRLIATPMARGRPADRARFRGRDEWWRVAGRLCFGKEADELISFRNSGEVAIGAALTGSPNFKVWVGWVSCNPVL